MWDGSQAYLVLNAVERVIEIDLRYRLSACLSSLHLLALQVSSSFRGDMEIVSQ